MGLELPKRARGIVLGTVIGSAALFLSGCSAEDKAEIKRLAMPEPATKEAHHMYELWQWSWLALLLTGVLVWGLILYAIIRFRRRDEGEIPVQTRYNLPIEIFYTVAPIVMVIVFFYFTIQTQNASLRQDDPQAKVTVVGQQWSWTFNYEDVDALGGETVHEGGTPAEKPTLWLVKDQVVDITLYSPDVIHSFWVPVFLFKMDVVPGRNTENHFTLTPDREGTFAGRCAELCGVYHSRMLFDVKVVSQSEFDAHMRDLEEQGNTGKALGGSQVNDQPGLEDHESNGGEQ